MAAAEVPAVQKQHIGSLGTHHLYAGEIVPYEVAGVLEIAVYHLYHLVGPGFPRRAEAAYKGVDGENVAVVVVAQPALPQYPVPEIFAVNYMIGAHQPRQGEGLAGGVEGHGALPCILGDALGGNVLIAGHDDVRPDFVGDDHTVMGGVDLHGLLYLPAPPDPAAGVVGGTEDGQVDVILLELPVHVLIVHAPYALPVPLQRGVDGNTARVLEGVGEAHICGRVDKNLLAGSGEGLEHGADAAQHAVFVADVFRQQALHPVAFLLPADDAVEIFFRQGEVAEVGHLHALVYGRHHRRGRLEAHVRYPHGDSGEAFADA